MRRCGARRPAKLPPRRVDVMTLLPAAAGIGHVELRLADRQRSLPFYCDLLGFRVIRDDGATVRLSATGREPAVLVLRFDPSYRPRPGYSAGLYHVAIRLPDRAGLAEVLRRIALARYPIQGASDHLVSEALYLADPEGNGLELETDRPASTWRYTDGQLRMDTLRLDLQDLLRQARPQDDGHLPAGTDIGHVHLSVSELGGACRFYHEALGMEVVVDSVPQALFLAAPGYHHHIGANTWESAGAPPAPADSVGLELFTVVVPTAADVEPVAAGLTAGGWPVRRVPGGLETRDATGTRVQVLAAAGR